MLIMRGNLLRSCGEKYGIRLPALDYVVRFNGAPVGEYDYRGPGTDNGTAIVIGDPMRTTTLFEYSVDAEPTPESVEYLNGFEYALGQLRSTPPQNVSTRFYEGWHAGYIEVLRETPEQRAERKRQIRSEREWAKARREQSDPVES